MAWRVYDYECADPLCGNIERDYLVWVTEELIEDPCCSKCGMPMTRQIACPVYHQDIVSYLESCGRVVPPGNIPPKPCKEI
ncbi:MAG: hypothetical protein UY48_C0005G0057 [Candidatus Gottesmanbacteria bacterium GW2011_GWB1_49_7]|uniref:Uncharacterized protein n=1 Tax=Candidatus Gottesmanbacteria bacterium GW2011_GWB1_49_7 TaxID=1618448 RepID=A0A0G1W2Z4_9BACT|nr:MAG: hypothetical protein UY48_C0005G0057 [Candidatus Gottesmanbacteria bacterium GW2011_GWB1_49_7]